VFLGGTSYSHLQTLAVGCIV